MKAPKLPPFLKPGDRIALVAPARSITPDEINDAIIVLEKAGFEVVPAQHLYAKHHAFAGTDEQRASDMQWAINDTGIKAIICARGGFGCLRIAHLIDFTPLLTNPKWVVGFSDITVFHSQINNLGICTIHAAMPISFKRDADSVQQLIATLSGNVALITWETEAPDINVKGIMCGGNLSLLYSLQGSGDLFMPQHGIVFLEDLDEYYYHIDRMILSLNRSGYFKNAVAVVCGDFSDMKDHTTPFGQNEKEIIEQHQPHPVVTGFPAGHDRVNMPLIMGAYYTLQVQQKKATLRISLK